MACPGPLSRDGTDRDCKRNGLQMVKMFGSPLQAAAVSWLGLGAFWSLFVQI